MEIEETIKGKQFNGLEVKEDWQTQCRGIFASLRAVEPDRLTQS